MVAIDKCQLKLLMLSKYFWNNKWIIIFLHVNFFGYSLIYGLIPEYNVHMVTSIHHKTDENIPNLQCMFLHQFLDFFNW